VVCGCDLSYISSRYVRGGDRWQACAAPRADVSQCQKANTLSPQRGFISTCMLRVTRTCGVGVRRTSDAQRPASDIQHVFVTFRRFPHLLRDPDRARSQADHSPTSLRRASMLDRRYVRTSQQSLPPYQLIRPSQAAFLTLSTHTTHEKLRPAHMHCCPFGTNLCIAAAGSCPLPPSMSATRLTH